MSADIFAILQLLKRRNLQPVPTITGGLSNEEEDKEEAMDVVCSCKYGFVTYNTMYIYFDVHVLSMSTRLVPQNAVQNSYFCYRLVMN